MAQDKSGRRARADPSGAARRRGVVPGFSGRRQRRGSADVAELSAAEIDKLAHLDYRHEMAFIALDEDTGHMLGFVRLKDELDEKTAEFAILVRSRFKGHGLGWLLMQRVIDYSKEKGLRRVYGDVLVENTAMLQMCTELGFYAQDMGPDIRRVVLDLENVGGRCALAFCRRCKDPIEAEGRRGTVRSRRRRNGDGNADIRAH